MLVSELEKVAWELKLDILRMFYQSHTGHLASALSCIELLSVLYFDKKLSADKVVLSKGHGVAALYAVLAKKGMIPREELNTFYGQNSRLLALASCTIPGIDVPTGSLGQGIGFAAGIAKAYKMDKKDFVVYCILGDGEMQEGSVWETAMSAANQRLGNFVVILDHNGIQASNYVKEIAPIEPVRAKWESFGWQVEEIDGHGLETVQRKLEDVRRPHADQPTLVIANTIKGHGISFIENQPNCHMRNPKGEEWQQVCQEFHITMEDLKQL